MKIQTNVKAGAGGLSVNHNQTVVRAPFGWSNHNQTLVLIPVLALLCGSTPTVAADLCREGLKDGGQTVQAVPEHPECSGHRVGSKCLDN